MKFQKGFLGPAPVAAPVEIPQIGPVEQILIAAKQTLRRGWIRGSLRNSEGVCAIGAIEEVYYRIAPHGRSAAYRILEKSLPLRWRLFGFALGDNRIPAFNDVPWRRKERVERLYDRAIAKAHRRGI